MKKNYIVSPLIGIIIFFSYISCVLGVDSMEKEYIVTINEINMYNSAATALLKSIIREEKELVNIVDKSTGKNISIVIEILKPGMNILINNSKNMESISGLLKVLEEHATKSPDKYIFHSFLNDGSDVTSIKIEGRFCLSGFSDKVNRITLCINNKIQITSMSIFKRDTTPSDTQKATPIRESYGE